MRCSPKNFPDSIPDREAVQNSNWFSSFQVTFFWLQLHEFEKSQYFPSSTDNLSFLSWRSLAIKNSNSFCELVTTGYRGITIFMSNPCGLIPDDGKSGHNFLKLNSVAAFFPHYLHTVYWFAWAASWNVWTWCIGFFVGYSNDFKYEIWLSGESRVVMIDQFLRCWNLTSEINGCNLKLFASTASGLRYFEVTFSMIGAKILVGLNVIHKTPGNSFER